MRRTAFLSLALALAASTGCAGTLSRNNKQGLAVVGGVTVIAGATVLMDGMSCDQANWNNTTCTHDNGELRNGVIVVGAGAALLGWALWQLAHDGAPAETVGPRTAQVKAAPTASATR